MWKEFKEVWINTKKYKNTILKKYLIFNIYKNLIIPYFPEFKVKLVIYVYISFIFSLCLSHYLNISPFNL